MTTDHLRRDALLLYLLALGLMGGVALALQTPGYMDADYYFGGALRLAQGAGFSEPYLWNYLAPVTALPAPSHLYWMPLTSLVAAAGMVVFGDSFRAAQVMMVLTAATLPVLALYIARVELGGSRRVGWVAGLLAALGGFFLVRWGTTDGFGLYGLVGTGFLLTTAHGLRGPGWRCWLAAGLLAALAHLTRADGVLLVGVGGLLALGYAVRERWPWQRLLMAWGLLVLGYLLLMGPWLVRNVLVIGSPLAPGGSQSLWLHDYNELFNYQQPLTLADYLAPGWGAIARQKLDGLWQMAQNMVAVQGLIVVTPLIVLAAWQRRRDPLVQTGLLYEAVLVLVMGVVFTLPGVRGGFFHSAAALHPLLMALGALGLDAAVDWAAARLPHWQPEAAKPRFAGLLLAVAAVLTLAVTVRPLQTWNADVALYAEGQAWLAANAPEAVLAVGNPPGWWAGTGHAAVVIPNGDAEMLWAVVEQFDVDVVLLDANHPGGLADVYAGRETVDWLRLATRLPGGSGGEVLVLEVVE